MAQQDGYGLQSDVQVLVRSQPTWGTPIVPTATESVRVTNVSVTKNVNRQPIRDSSQSRSLVHHRDGMHEVEWEISHYLAIPATGSNPIAQTQLWTSAIGVGAAGAGGAANFNYTLSNAQSLPAISSIYVQVGDLTATSGTPQLAGVHSVTSAWANEWEFSVSQGELPQATIRGGAERASFTHATSTNVIGGAAGQTATDAAFGTGAATLTLDSNHGERFDVGSVISFPYTQSASSLTHTAVVTGVVGDALNFAPPLDGSGGATITLDSNADITIPQIWSEAQVDNDRPCMNEISGSFSAFGLTNIRLQAFNVKITNNVKSITPALQQYVQDITPGHRVVEGSFTVLYQSGTVQMIDDTWGEPALNSVPDGTGSALNRNPSAATVIVGDATNGQIQISMPAMVADFNSLSIDATSSEPIELEIPFIARATLSGGVSEDNEITIQTS